MKTSQTTTSLTANILAFIFGFTPFPLLFWYVWHEVNYGTNGTGASMAMLIYVPGLIVFQIILGIVFGTADKQFPTIYYFLSFVAGFSIALIVSSLLW